MKPMKFLLVFASLCLALTAANAQDKEAGIFLGAAQYQGDLSQKQITLNETKPSLGILMRYYFNPRLNFKGGLYLGWVEGSDVNYDTERERLKRNLSFRSHIIELAGQVEFNILPYISNSRRYKFAPFVFAGIALYHFNPVAEVNGAKYKLHDYGTEGQLTANGPKQYNLLQGSIPFGLGIKYSLGNFWNLSFELGQRKLFTDYLDDVSDIYPDKAELLKQPNGQTAVMLSDRGPEIDPKFDHEAGDKRGDSEDLDLYIFTGFTITKTIRRFSCTGF